MNHCGGKTKSSAFSIFTLRVREIHAEKERRGGEGGGRGGERVKKNLDNLLQMENLRNMQEK